MDKLADTLEQLRVLVESLPPMEEPQEGQVTVAVSHKPNLPAKSPSKSNEIDVPSGKLTIRESPTAKDRLTDLLNQTYAMLKKYGEAADVTAMRDAGFQMVLGDYPIEDVQRGFIEYLKTGKEIPTPADILAIVDPTTQPMDKAYYIKLIERDKRLLEEGRMFRLSEDEYAYIERYEQQELRKVQS